VLQGRLTVLVGEQELTLGPGDERTVQPGTAHRWRAAEAGAQFLVRMTPGLRFAAAGVTPAVGLMLGHA
jgi:quercetin dioxygenase-like cupin family protein